MFTTTATIRLLDRIRLAQGCSDYRASQLLGVTRSTVSRWRTGAGHMGAAIIPAACKLAEEPHIFRWEVEIGAERERGPDGDFYRKMRDEFAMLEAGLKPGTDWYMHSFILALKGYALALAGVVLLTWLPAHDAHASIMPEVSAVNSGAYATRSIHYANSCAGGCSRLSIS